MTLSKAPTHWEQRRLRTLVESATNGSWGSEPGNGEAAICIRATDFDRVRLRVKPEAGVERSFAVRDLTQNRLKVGDILLEKSGGGARQPVGKAVLFDRPNCVAVGSNFVARLRPSAGVDPRFLVLVLESLYVTRMNVRHIKQNTGIQNLDEYSYFSETVPLPPPEEQQAIVRLVEERTEVIDSLLERGSRLIRLFDEERQALVTRCVTRGLSNGPLRPSGIRWMGDIPGHWTVRRIKQVARLASGHTPSRAHPEYWLDADIPWFQLTDIWQFRDDSRDTIYETAERISELGIRNSAAEVLPSGTVALSRTASVGYSAILGVAMATTQDFANWVPGPMVDSRYLLFVMRAIRPELERSRVGSTHKTVYMPAIAQLMMPVPPLDEQREIVGRIRSESSRLFAARATTELLIGRLKEYRAALITAAVTGQIDVRSAA